ncbi:HigA family addiction module antitoxin [Marinicella sp. S1101]|uniref:HigA family addiction module antitoxin n=1 Tax=Marinicella marina TaxID=2996016 RepID=UPI00226082B8|nr:HigA family addiction module antitoxin [Marinicella marina]MCX7554400.1 HigA family addiction module antitoxin [Marinicella marina]MDJ1138609.1 HigA family addiction module antitoxin [Marinicella marina]
MNMKNPAHPGVVFLEMYLKPSAISVTKAAQTLGCSRKHLSGITNGKASVSADMAARISKMTSTSARFWLGMQNSFDLAQLDMNNYKDIQADQSMPVVNA